MTTPPPALPLVFLDTETTSLHEETRRAWDIYMIRQDGPTIDKLGLMIADIDLALADTKSLNIGHYYTRHPLARLRNAHDLNTALADISFPYLTAHLNENEENYHLVTSEEAARLIERFTRGTTLVAACPHFDAQHLAALLREYGHAPSWHHRMIDVYSMLAGHLGHWPAHPWDEIKKLGIHTDEAQLHTAAADAVRVKELYEALTEPK